MAYTEIKQNEFWKPENPGDSIEGEVLSKQEGQFGNQWTIKTESGDMVTPAHAVLQSRMGTVNIGDKIKVEFIGKEMPKVKGHSPTALYKIYKDE